jgi:hypothetical protein
MEISVLKIPDLCCTIWRLKEIVENYLKFCRVIQLIAIFGVVNKPETSNKSMRFEFLEISDLFINA